VQWLIVPVHKVLLCVRAARVQVTSTQNFEFQGRMNISAEVGHLHVKDVIYLDIQGLVNID